MKIIKKISIILLALALCVPSISMVAYAADGSITFTDPETKVGDMVDIKCAVRSDNGDIGEVELALEYDSESLRFDSGDGVTKDGDGTLTYTGTGNSAEVAFTMKFQALKEGSAQVSITSATVNSGYGSTMSMEEGNSTVTIGEGDPSKIKDEEEETEDEEGDGESSDTPAAAGDVQVVVDGTTYTLTDKFADADIPAGYSRTTVSLEGEDRQMVENESGNICLGYLVDSGNVGDFFMYNKEDATFAPYEEIAISDTTSIIVLSDTSKVKLPGSYKEVGLTLNDKEFPVWQDKEHDGYYIIYAMNNNGETGYYQYDSNDGTYQRVEISAAEEKKEKKEHSFLGKFQGFFDKHFPVMFIVLCLLGIAFIVLIIVLAVKLRNRNLELDDLYDEYGIDLEDEEPPVKEKEKEKKPKFGFRKREGDEDEDEDDFDEDSFGGLAISKINLDDDDFDEDDFDEDDFGDDGFDEDDFEEGEIKKAVKKPAKKSDKKSSKKSVKKSSIRAGEDDIFSDKKLKKYDTKTVRQNMTIGEMDDGGDLDDLLEDLSGKKPGHQENDDAFKVDFVDLD